MRLTRTLRAGFALLFALMLPLQAYAAMPPCARHDPTKPRVSSMAESAATQTHCAPAVAPAVAPGVAPAAIHHHGCGNCCCGPAIALTPALWVAPLLTVPEICVATPWAPPSLALDRLDRPPRFISA